MKRKKKIAFGITAVLLCAVNLYYIIQNEKLVNNSLTVEQKDKSIIQDDHVTEYNRHGKDMNRPRYRISEVN